MSNYRDEEKDDEFDDTSVDKDLPDPSDMDDEDELPTMPCPYCKKPVHEESEICPHCGTYISEEDAPHPLPAWMWIGIALLALVGLLYLFSFLGALPLRW